MPFDPFRHHRHSIRLDGYDYTRAGLYYVTIVTQGRIPLFGAIVDGQVVLNAAGEMVFMLWDELASHYPGVEIDAFVVMPNHLHGIIMLTQSGMVGAAPRGRLPDESSMQSAGQVRGGASNGQPEWDFLIDQPQGSILEGQPQGVVPTTPEDAGNPPSKPLSLPDVMHRFKSLSTHRYAKGVEGQGWPAFEGRLWQRSYYDHIIRDENDLTRIRTYIMHNPASWDTDSENPFLITERRRESKR